MECSRLIIRKCLEILNEYRARHNIIELVYEEELEYSALIWAKDLARIQKNIKSLYNGIFYGETVMVKHNVANNLTGQEIAATWYIEGKNYDYETQTGAQYSANFTQLIWAATREIGIGIVYNEDNQAYVVAHYRPFGNIIDQFHFNVFAPCIYKVPLMPSLIEMNLFGMNQHNIYRSWHGSPPLVICHDLIASAQKWAEKLAPLKGKIQFANYCSLTESIAVKFDPFGYICNQKVTKDWYSSGKEFDYSTFQIGANTNNFSKIVWRNTREIGFGRASFQGYHYLVVHYRPPAHIGSFVDNIPKLINTV